MISIYNKKVTSFVILSLLLSFFLNNRLSSQNLDILKISDISAFDYEDFKVAPNGDYWVLMTDNKIYNSKDNGLTWIFNHEFDKDVSVINIFSDSQVLVSGESLHYIQSGINTWNNLPVLEGQRYIYFKDDIVYTEISDIILSSKNRGETTEFLIEIPTDFKLRTIRISESRIILLNELARFYEDYSDQVLVYDRNTNLLYDSYEPAWGASIKFIEILDDDRIVYNVITDQTAADGPYYEDVYIGPFLNFGTNVFSSQFEGTVFHGMTIFDNKIYISLPSCLIKEYDLSSEEKKTYSNFPYGSLYTDENNLFILNEFILEIEDLEFGMFSSKAERIEVAQVEPKSYSGSVFDVSSNGKIYYPLNGRLFESIDYGETWIDLDTDNERINDWELSANGDLYVYTFCNIFYKAFDKDDFEVYPHSLYGTFVSTVQNEVNFTYFSKVTSDFIVMSANTGWLSPTVYKISYDNGQTWEDCPDNCFAWDVFYESDNDTYKIVENKLVTLAGDDVFDVNNSPFDFLQYEMFIVSDEEIHFIPIVGVGPSYLTRDFGASFVELSDAPAGDLVKGPEIESTFILSKDRSLYYRENVNSIYRLIDISFLPNVFMIASDKEKHVYIGSRDVFRIGNDVYHDQVIKGSIYFDENQSCSLDGSDFLSDVSWKVNLQGNGIDLTTYSLNGEYEFNVPIGDYSISVLYNGPRWSFCNDENEVSLSFAGEEIESNFFVYADAICTDINLDVSSSRLRACVKSDYNIYLSNIGTKKTEGLQLEVTLDEQFEFLDSNYPSTILADNKLLLEIGSVNILGLIKVRVSIKLSCDAVLGAEHCIGVKVIDDDLCSDVTEIQFSEYQVNVGPFDPNDMRVFDHTGTRSYQFDKDEFQYYHVRFQNTGTDTAYNVVLLNYLDPKLDLSSLEVINSSHNYNIEFSGDHNLVIKYDNIYLPDSFVNEPASNGYIKYKLKPLSDIKYGDILKSECDIYFDVNEPVRTNIAEVLIDKDVCNERIRYETISGEICDGENIYGFNEEGFHQLMFKANDGCDSLLNIVVEKVNEKYYNNENISICEGDEYQGLLRDTFYIDNLMSINGCDSIERLRLRVLDFGDVIENNLYILPGDTINGFFEPGIYVDTIIGWRCQENINTVAYKTIEESYEYIEICSGSLYEGHSQSGIYKDSIDEGAIFKIRTLELLVLDGLSTYLDIVICENESYNGYSESGSYEDYLFTEEGCDSIVYLELLIEDDEVVNLTKQLCDGQEFETYSQSGIYIDTFANIRGCDSIRILDLKIEDEITSILEMDICQGDSFESYSASGQYQDVFTSSSGCDSIRNLILNVFDVSQGQDYVEICDGEEYQGYNATGNYDIVSQTINGCDSITDLSLNVLEGRLVYLDQEVCAGSTFEGYSVAGIYEDTFLGSNGCDSTRVLELTIMEALSTVVDTTLCPGQLINGVNPIQETTLIYTSMQGCDSTVLYKVLYNQHHSETCQENRIGLFPNPTNESITLIEEVGNKIEAIQIYDAIGNFIETRSSSQGLSFGIHDFDDGVYLFRIETENKRIEIHKVIKI